MKTFSKVEKNVLKSYPHGNFFSGIKESSQNEAGGKVYYPVHQPH
jgi:hypothetical protein